MQPTLTQFLSTGITRPRPNCDFKFTLYKQKFKQEYNLHLKSVGLPQNFQPTTFHHIISLDSIEKLAQASINLTSNLEEILKKQIPQQYHNQYIWTYIAWFPNNIMLGPSPAQRSDDPVRQKKDKKFKTDSEEALLGNSKNKSWKAFSERFLKCSSQTQPNNKVLAQLFVEFIRLPRIEMMQWTNKDNPEKKYRLITTAKKLQTLPPHLVNFKK